MRTLKKLPFTRMWGKSLAILLTITLILGSTAVPVSAKADTGTPPSSLAVYVTVDGKKELIHDYTIGDMERLIDGKNVRYSSIDAMPSRVLTVADGVYLSTLLSDLKKYTKVHTENFTKVKLRATDGWIRTYTVSELSKPVYYYENLFTVDTWDTATGKAGALAAVKPVSVKPMLAVSSWQGRILKSTKEVSSKIGVMDKDALFRFCPGMHPESLNSGNSTTSEFGRWIHEIEVIMPETVKEMPTLPGQWKNNFTDVMEKDWYYKAVEFVNTNHLFQGVALDRFGPHEKMTRGMFVTVLGRMAKAAPPVYKNTFKDVEAGQYYAGYVAWASHSNLVSGLSAELFGPSHPITREQMAMIMYRYGKSMKLDSSNTDDTKCLAYADYQNTMTGAREAICWAVNRGIMAGNKGKLNPKGEASRSEVAQIM
ncbi:MAG: S-layer homology domain-containing protein, partial [Anaerovorax sp.]